MALFLSTYTNKVDKKGRVSVPASFRQAVTPSNFKGIIVYPHLTLPCLEGADMNFLEKISDHLDTEFGPFNPDQATIATAILADSSSLSFDPEGRVMLPQDLLEFAEIDGQATFAGLGPRFQIWNPDAFTAHKIEARKKAAVSGPALAPRRGGGQP